MVLGTLKNNVGERYFNLKLVEKERVLGFAICQMVLDEATLFNIAIDPAQQGKGYGSFLLQGLMDKLKEKGIQTLWLEVRESNPARFLYEKLGLMRLIFVRIIIPNQMVDEKMLS